MKNRSVPQSYWNIVKRITMEICGDYICEEIMEMHTFLMSGKDPCICGFRFL